MVTPTHSRVANQIQQIFFAGMVALATLATLGLPPMLAVTRNHTRKAHYRFQPTDQTSIQEEEAFDHTQSQLVIAH
jgi:hypothetical protein